MVTWYAAHLVFYVKFKAGRQTRYPIWENVVLISAKHKDDAFVKAEKRGWDDPCMQPDPTFTWGGKPAEWVFAGVRKLTLCVDEDERPRDGTEVTYLELEAASKGDLEKLMNNEPVSVRIEDGFPEEMPTNGRPAVANKR